MQSYTMVPAPTGPSGLKPNVLETQPSLRLPRVRAPRGFAASPRGSIGSPKTPRRRQGRVAAGAAFACLAKPPSPSSSPATSPVHPAVASCIRSRSRRSRVVASQGDGSTEQEYEVKKAPASERSQAVNEELLLFFFQLDLGTRLQRALNQEQYEVAQQLRERINEVEQEGARLKFSRRGSPAKSEVTDKTVSALRLRSELQKAIEEERYSDAAKIRDQLTQIESETLAAKAAAQANIDKGYQFRLGQKVRHKVHGYRGVICGYDPVCSESKAWQEANGVAKLTRGLQQPYYYVLVDTRENPGFIVVYVAEELLREPPEPDKERFDHPYLYLLFFGVDGAGDFIPSKQLREKYNAERHELPWGEPEPTEEEPPEAS